MHKLGRPRQNPITRHLDQQSNYRHIPPARRFCRSRNRCQGLVLLASTNALEQLRQCNDPSQRAQIMLSLDGKWQEAYDTYAPSAVETCLCEVLGISPYNCMLVVVLNPSYSGLGVDSQVKPSLNTLLGFGIDRNQVWNIISKRPFLLSNPVSLQRWMDFLAVHGLNSKAMQVFLQNLPEHLLHKGTLHQASKTVSFLKSLGVNDDFIATRLGLCPELLITDVPSGLQPVTLYLMSCGASVPQIGTLVMQWPQILLVDVDQQLKPFVQYLKGWGCNSQQVVDILLAKPQAVRGSGEEAFGARISKLHDLGLSVGDVATMVAKDAGFLTVDPGFDEQLAFLQHIVCLDRPQLAKLLVHDPRVLREKVVDLERKWEFLTGTLHGYSDSIILHPSYLSASLVEVTGPRHVFLVKKGLLPKLEVGGALDLTLLVSGDDALFCSTYGLSVNEYSGFRLDWEQEYTVRLIRESRQKFQEELRKAMAS